jgi:hypothetical protein
VPRVTVRWLAIQNAVVWDLREQATQLPPT